jgi:hypothetical protein
MQPIEAAKADPTAGVVPRPRAAAAWRAVAVEALPELRLRVTFVAGASGGAEGSRRADMTDANANAEIITHP